MSRDSTVVLQEILDAIALARESVADAATFDRFAVQRINRAATERAIEIISEAVRHLPTDMLSRHPTLPWSEIKAIGNKLRHEYHGVEPKIVWDVVLHDLDELERVVRSELAGPT
jgi:uncharacterized protein with HEPN domain